MPWSRTTPFLTTLTSCTGLDVPTRDRARAGVARGSRVAVVAAVVVAVALVGCGTSSDEATESTAATFDGGHRGRGAHRSAPGRRGHRDLRRHLAPDRRRRRDAGPTRPHHPHPDRLPDERRSVPAARPVARGHRPPRRVRRDRSRCGPPTASSSPRPSFPLTNRDVPGAMSNFADVGQPARRRLLRDRRGAGRQRRPRQPAPRPRRPRGHRRRGPQPRRRDHLGGGVQHRHPRRAHRLRHRSSPG